MANNLVPYNPPPGNGASPPAHGPNGQSRQKPNGTHGKAPVGSHNDPDQEQWDLPPSNARHSYFGSYASAQREFQEAHDAERHGDRKLARGRRQDAEENLQQIWDPSDLRTWLIIAVMFFFGILLATSAYVLPHGRDASPPLINVR